MTIKKQGFLQALGVVLYIGIIGLFINNAEKMFDDLALPFGPILFLLLFSSSILICAALVLYKPYKLFIENKKKEALDTVVSTAIFLFGFLLIFLGALLLFK